MTIVIGGHNLGLQDGSLGLLNRNDQTSNGTLDQRMQAFANVANGNLIIQERDVFLPSRGEDFQLVRTYNSRGALSGSSDGWSYSTAITLSSHQDKPANSGPSVTNYLVTYGDGSQAHFDFDSSRNLWVSTDGAGAYETLQVLNQPAADGTKFRLTRADQSQYNFDKDFVFVSMVDTNGVRTEFSYQGGRVQTVRDDTGHVVTYQYDGIGKLAAIVDESGARLVSYGYSQGALSTVTDRFGHVTTYSYTSNGLLAKISLPFRQIVNGQQQTFDTREIQFTYQSISWDDHPHLPSLFDVGSQWALSSITDALGGVTTFENAFVFNPTAPQPGDRDLAYKDVGGRSFAGGTTRMVDAMGNGLATSNAAEFRQKRVALGFAADVNALSAAQKEALRQQFSMSYSFDPDGYITQVTDQQGFKTTYTYGGKTSNPVDQQTAVNQDNLLSIVDRNGWGATNSDSAYFRALRKDLGVVDGAGNGKLVANLTTLEKNQLLAKFTTRFTYDERGNLLTSTDGLGNQTSYTYTAFNKVASMTSAMGNALVSLDHLNGTDNFYRDKRVELGAQLGLAIPNVAFGSLSAAHKTALLDLYTTKYTYDAKQNLIAQIDPGGDRTEFEYDAFGNLTKRTVIYRDAANVAVPAKNQVTNFAYDQYGNNVSIVDAQGHTTTKTFDHFGNVLAMVDGRGGVTTYTYDGDNRLLTVIDPEGLTTAYAYDAVGNRIGVTYANGHTITQVFDRNNMLIATIDPGANAALTRNTTFRYDILGNRAEMTDAEGRKATYTFDARRQLVDVATPQVLNGAEALVTYHTTYAYDGESNMVTFTDNNGNVTQSLYTANGLLKRETDPIGNVTEFLYDANLMQVQITIGAHLVSALRRVLRFGRDEENQLISTTDPMGGIERQAFDAPGNVESITDVNGNRTDFEYDRNNRLVKETRPTVADPLTGQPIRYMVLHQYDANGNEIATTDENGNVTTFAFDKDDRSVMVTDGNGIKTVFSWDARANQTQIAIGVNAHLDATTGKVVIDSVQQAAMTTFVYDEFNQLISTTDAVGNALVSSDLPVYQTLRTELGFDPLVANLSDADKTTLRNRFTERYEYDRVGNLTKLADHLGRVESMTYDALDRLQSRTEALGTAQQRTDAFRYDGNANLVKRTDFLGRITRTTYDGNDRAIDETDPLGVVTHRQYDDVGNVISVTEAFGTLEARNSTFIYDLNNRLTRATDPEGHVKQYEYDAVGNRLKEIDARGGITQYVYDALNRNIKIIDPLSFQTLYEYDGVGNRITIVDANGGIERMEYDAGNRYIQTTDPEGRVTKLAYDPLNNVITQTTAADTPEAQVTSYVYDAEGNLRQVTDAAGKVSSQGFDDVYNLTRSTDANGHTTTMGFDALNRQIRVVDALGGITTYTYDLEDNELSETDPLGRTRSFQYDDRDQMITATDALGTPTTYAYDAVGNQVRITRAASSAQARTTAFVYDKDDRLISETDPLGHTKTYAYDANDNVVSTKDALGRETTYTYDAANQLTQITDPLDHVTQFKYDGKGNRSQVIDARGNAMTVYYNLADEVVLNVDAEGNAIANSYDGNGNLVGVTEYMTPIGGAIDPAVMPVPTPSAEDRVTTFEYDKLNRVAKRTDALGGVFTMTYDAVGNKIAETDENGPTTSFVYDALDRLTRRTDPLGGIHSMTYDAVGNELSMTDENGHTTSYEYDANDRLTQQTDPLAGVRTFTFDSVGNQLSTTDENGHTTIYAYDLDDRLIEETNALAGVKTYAYDAVGNRTQFTDENGHVTTYAYDADDRLTKQTDPLGGERTREYDAVDNVMSMTDENGHTTSYTYDKLNRLIAETDPLQGVKSVLYDAVGNQIRATDENGHATEFEYDKNDRLIKRIDALGGERLFAYDAVGNRISVTDENGHATSYEYDANDRLITEIDALGSERLSTYDAAGNQLSVTDENGHTTSFGYDANDRLTKRTDALGGERLFAYDAVGNQLSETDENGHKTSFTYDALNRQLTRTNAIGGALSFTYDAVGNQLSAIDENGHATSFAYDASDRLIARTDALGNDKQHTYDAAGNLTSQTDENGHKTTFGYDANDRLIRQTDALGGVMTFAYDGVGNKISETDENGHTTTFTYDENNRKLTEIDALGKTEICAYDAAGNRLAETNKNGHATTYTYDALDRIASVTDPLGFATGMRYDAVGNILETRQQLSLDDPSQEEVARYAYDALDRRVSSLSAEGFLRIFEYDAVGLLVKTTAFDDRFAPTPAGEAPLTGSGDSRITLADYDAINRMVSETSPLGFVTSYEYDAVGNRTAMVEAHGTPEARRAEMDYDANDRLIQTLDALGIVTRMELDAVGNTLEVHEAFGTPDVRVTESEYDENDRLIRQTDALGIVTEFDYDGVGNMTERRRAVGLPEARTEHFEYDANRRETAQINGEGERTEYAYDGVGNRTSLIVAKGLPEQRINRFRFDGDNKLIGETDGNGVETQYEYDGAGNKVKTIQLAAVYDSDGNSIGTYQGQSIDGLQRETLFAYDLDNRLIEVTDPMSGVTQYEVDALGNRTRIVDANGTQTVNTFDAAGRILTNWVQASNHGGVLVTNSYDAFGNIVQTRRGFHDGTDTRQTTYTYDERDRQTSITEYDKVDALGPSTVFSQAFSAVFEYDAFDNQTKVAQGLYLLSAGEPGYDAAKALRAQPLIAAFEHDEHDQLVSATDGVGNVLAYTNDAYGNRLSQTTGFGTPDARTAMFTYDRADRLLSRRTGTGSLVTLRYDEAGNQAEKRTLQSGSETGSGADAPVWITETFSYDGNGRVIHETDGLGVATMHVLDAFGNETATRFADGNAEERTVRSEFDANNALTAEIDALGNRTRYEVDKIGNRIAATDALGFVTRLYYDELNQQIAALDPEGFLTTFGRDSDGNVLAVDIYQQRYAAPSDHRVAPTPAASDTPRVTSNEYDGSGNLIRKTEPDQRVKDFVYNSAGKLLQIIDRGSSLAAAQALTADPSPRVQTFEYDAAGRLARFSNVDGVTEDYGYDGANNRISETITNPDALPGGASDPVRITVYEYDDDNRQTAQIFDPDGLNHRSTLGYDKAGNVIANTDARGNVTRMTYDLGNRMLSITDPLDAMTLFGYDSVGNRTSTTDALANETRFEYDLNNRVTKVILPAVDVFTIRDGLQTDVHPTSETRYDAVGNAIQEIDADGFKSSAFYDGNRNRIAEINGDNVLRTFTYDANGLLTEAGLYMTRVDASSHDAAAPPTPPSGEVRTLVSEFDLAGRLIRTIYPEIERTSLSGVSGGDPTITTTTVAPEETHAYNAFGERVQSTDRNGNTSYAYFDERGRAVVTVDAVGYLIETAYDSQGNVVQQRKYATPLDPNTVSAATRPDAPSGDAFAVDRTYDAANRLVEELLPPVEVDGVEDPVRVKTRYTYDANGNRTSRTLAADSPDAATEHYYYDAANRQVAIVNDARVLHLMTYDANGNKTSLKRFIDPISTPVTLPSATVSALIDDVTPDDTQDQETTFAYDALNRETSRTEVMGPGTADDITISSKYDARNNLSGRTDPEGFVSQTAYDALGHVTQTRSPDGNRSFVEYDAAGFRVKAWTGDLGENQASAATDVAASIGNALSVSWVAGDQLTSYVVYDTEAHDVPGDYANESAQQGGGATSVDVDLTGLSAGTIVYFRVVTVDAAGSKAWTDEYSVTVPVLLNQLSVTQVGSDLEVTVRFNGTVTNPELRVGAGQTLNTTVTFDAQGDGSYKAVITNPAQGGQGLSYQARWTANGNTYTTAATPFEAPGEHRFIDGTFTWPVPELAQGNTQIVFVDGVRQDNAFQVNGQLQFTTAPLTNGDHVYHVLYGEFVAESHSLKVTNRDNQTTLPPSTPVETKDADGNVIRSSRTFTYQHNYSSRIEVTLDAEEASRAADTLQIAYRTAGDTSLGGFTAADVTQTDNTFSADAALEPGTYDIKVSYIHAGQEVIVEWRRITVQATELHAPTEQIDDTDPFEFDNLPSSFTHDVSTVALNVTGVRSVTVLGRESDGEITKTASGNVSVDAGLYAGPVDPGNAAFTVPVATTGSAGGDKDDSITGTTATYFTEIEYNALGAKIASNEDTGLWRRFGVDANGNTLVTRIYGTKDDEDAGHAPIVILNAFDARDLEIARFGAMASVDADGDGSEETTARAVTRFTYDFEGRKVSELDSNPGALAQHFEYDAVGNLIKHTDAVGAVTQMFYDRRGNEVRRVDARDSTQRFVYDAAGRKVEEIDALNNTTAFDYDAFDRLTSITDALGNTTDMSYDQHDRLIEVEDAEANSTKYTYDKRDNRTWTEDANHHFFGLAYDAMSRVTNAYSFQSDTSASAVAQAAIDADNLTPTPTTLAQAIEAIEDEESLYHDALVNESIAYDIYGNKIVETDAMGRERFFTYGAFGRLAKQTDEGGRVTTFGYDRFGRIIGETRPKDDTVTGAKDIARTYDENGRLKSVTDATTQVSTTYTYDAAGNRMHETILAPTFSSTTPETARNVTYGYDGLGRMLSWSDEVTGKNLSYSYDAVGNQVGVEGSDGVDHTYTFDENNRVIKVTQGETLIAEYTYDEAGNRETYNDGSSTATYTYDEAGRVTQADIAPNSTPDDVTDDTHIKWEYDAVGNVTKYEELKDTAVVFTQTHRYTANNRTQQTSTDDQRDSDDKSIVSSLNQLDKTGRVLVEGRTDSTDSSDVKTSTFTHTYTADGRELSVTGTGAGDATGSSTSTFDANDHLVRLDLGQGDDQDSAEFKLFIYNNDGQILRRQHDDGENDTTNPVTEFLYASGNPVGETGTKTDGTTETVLDSGNYSLIKNLGETFPTASVSEYVVRSGDTLQSIAAQVYGNPSLWFLIADANGLTGSEQLKAGTRLVIPNGNQIGRLTADTHKVYNQSEIVGSTLPNLKSPPSNTDNTCAVVAAIILAIVIAILAVVITIFTAGLAAPVIAGLLGVAGSTVATMIVGAVVGAVVGTVIGIAASAITQGINIALNLQKEFDWKQFAADAVSGVIGGIGGALSGTIQALIKVANLATTIARLARIAVVAADIALQVAGEAAAQAIVHDGRIEQPWMLGVAAGAGIAGEVILGALGSRAVRNIFKKKGSSADIADAASSGVGKRVSFADGDEVITTRSASAIGKAGNSGVASTLKKVDTVFDEASDASRSARSSLEVKDPGAVLEANGNNASMKPLGLDDNASSTLSVVQSPIALDEGVGLDANLAARKMISGETSAFDQDSVVDFAEGSVGKVANNANTVPIVDLIPRQRVVSVGYLDAKPSRNLEALDLANRGKVSYEDAIGRVRSRSMEAPPMRTRFGDADQPQPIAPSVLNEAVGADDLPMTGAYVHPDDLLDLPPIRSRASSAAEDDLEFAEQPLDLMPGVARSEVGGRIDSTTEKALRNYAAQGMEEFASSAEDRAQQFAAMAKNLRKVKSSLFVGSQVRKQAKNELKLIQDTINDKTIMTSEFVSSPAHALELKRLGLPPSAAGRVGNFTDARLEGSMKELGSGNVNTVYLGKYTLPDDEGTFEGVFKPELREWGEKPPDVAYGTGIDEDDFRGGYRNVATTRLGDMLGFKGLTTRSEMAIHNQRLGTVSEKAAGVAPQGSPTKVFDKQPLHQTHIDNFKRNNPGTTPANFLQRWNKKSGNDNQLGMKMVDGERKYFYLRDTRYDINYGDPTLRRDLVRLQLMDGISGQVDRHSGNYFVKQDMNGKVLGVKGIDNDLSWGKSLRNIGQGARAGNLPSHLPPVVDKEAFDSIMAMNPQSLKRRMGGLLTTEEIDAASDRLLQVQNHLRQLEADGRVLSNLDDWTRPDVTDLLKETTGSGSFKEFSNYFARDLELQENSREVGRVVPYPEL